MNIQNIIRWLLPKEDGFYVILEQQADVNVRITKKLQDGKQASLITVAGDISILEHEGDALVRKMDASLSETFVTPVDREDLHQVSSLLDDIADLSNLTARSVVLYRLDTISQAMLTLIDMLADCAVILSSAISKLREHSYAKITEELRAVKVIEKAADDVFRTAIGELFASCDDAIRLMKEKEILEDIENTIDACNDVATLLSNLAVKYS
jgi:predicted phosphate transport protein (TIGR00153 family)